MNVREKDPAEPIRKAAELLVNVHITDSNRQAVGHGDTDFGIITRALKEVNGLGALASEPLRPFPNPPMTAQMQRYLL